MIENLREDLGVEKLAERMSMSSRHFTRVCLRETRMNPGQFVDRLRVEAAQQMIDSSEMGLKEIADTCGFQSTLSMRRSFVRVIGITAGEYASRFKRTQCETPEKAIVKRSVTKEEKRSKGRPRSAALPGGR
jgi:transcriptional regulator GlxA family with amidase domain